MTWEWAVVLAVFAWREVAWRARERKLWLAFHDSINASAKREHRHRWRWRKIEETLLETSALFEPLNLADGPPD